MINKTLLVTLLTFLGSLTLLCLSSCGEYTGNRFGSSSSPVPKKPPVPTEQIPSEE